ncbi:hypothetical protein AGRA3207_001093 [Actinomadura graeca]|uniref:Uncharacterized protein n=1 Tax=Actinomadura graeca TaxID=2750812 RepID=A0ABX8QQD5_9ACTN|nr:hypothetical protein [Actinomadura graeca]QXJ20389.1 hypothetical protein AGRA3207_001093 [Actinomadura graeca]
MTMIPGLVRRAAAEAEQRLRTGVREGSRLLARLGRDLERSAELERLLPSYAERIRTLEASVRSRDEELAALRAEVESLVAQLNERLLPRLDERMDDTERDLAAVATSLIRTGRDTAGNRARLDAAERRIGDLRTKLAQTEQRAGLWRDLQATMARLGDDVDALRVRAGARTADTPAPAPVPEPSPPHPAEHVTDRPA